MLEYYMYTLYYMYLIDLALMHRNPDITHLPLALGRLRNCWELTLNGLKVSNVPQHLLPGVARGGSTKHLLAYLRAQLRHCVPYNRMKLMAVGLQVCLHGDCALV